jgi:hypothetical protein
VIWLAAIIVVPCLAAAALAVLGTAASGREARIEEERDRREMPR